MHARTHAPTHSLTHLPSSPRSYPRLEAALDWLLSAYKFLFPFLVGGGRGWDGLV